MRKLFDMYGTNTEQVIALAEKLSRQSQRSGTEVANGPIDLWYPTGNGLHYL